VRCISKGRLQSKQAEHPVYTKLSGRWQRTYSLKTTMSKISLLAFLPDNAELLFTGGEDNTLANFAMSLAGGVIRGSIDQRESIYVGFNFTNINQHSV